MDAKAIIGIMIRLIVFRIWLSSCLCDMFSQLSYLVLLLRVLRAEPIDGSLQFLVLLSDGHNLCIGVGDFLQKAFILC